MSVNVRLPFVNLYEGRGDWLMEPKEVKPGLLAARTLLGDDDKYAAIRFINLSGTDQVIRRVTRWASLFPVRRTL